MGWGCFPLVWFVNVGRAAQEHRLCGDGHSSWTWSRNTGADAYVRLSRFGDAEQFHFLLARSVLGRRWRGEGGWLSARSSVSLEPCREGAWPGSCLGCPSLCCHHREPMLLAGPPAPAPATREVRSHLSQAQARPPGGGRGTAPRATGQGAGPGLGARDVGLPSGAEMGRSRVAGPRDCTYQ